MLGINYRNDFKKYEAEVETVISIKDLTKTYKE